MKVFDCFPFFNELDVLEIRLHEMAPLVSAFIILESGETYGGAAKPYVLREAMQQGRFAEFADKIVRIQIPELQPKCVDRTTGRLREAYQRNMIMPAIAAVAQPDDVIVFSDCDEIPRRSVVESGISWLGGGIVRLKQNSFYYTVNRLADYGNDFASRARMGTWRQVEECGTMYSFRMAKVFGIQELDNAGWHFGYFNNGTGIDHIKEKVASLSPFLAEYRLFGDKQLVRDIIDGKDLHHRRCEMPETFAYRASDDPTLPQHFLDNRERFAHFTEEWYLKAYRGFV